MIYFLDNTTKFFNNYNRQMTSTIREKQSFYSSHLDRSDRFKFKLDIPVRSLPKTRAGVTVVWLENTSSSFLIGDNSRLHTFAHDHRCSVLFYSNVTKCIKYLKRARSREYVVLVIVSYPVEEIQKIIYRLRRYRIVQTIYIVSSEKDINDSSLLTVNDVTVFDNKISMHDRLELLIDNIENENYEGGSFTTFYRKEKALKDVEEELGAYIWNHICKSQ